MLPDLPAGGIALWSGSVGSIPTDWALCDGTNGTPDLRNKFEVAAGDTYSPADTGGSLTHQHNFTSDGHVHTVRDDDDIDGPGDRESTTGTNQLTGTTENNNTIAPYYSLAYIMKL